MPALNKLQVPSAQEHKTKLDLSFDHVTTMGFMYLRPVGYRHMVAGEHVSVTPDVIVRPAPIEVPFYGSCVVNTRSFYVPYRLAFPQYDSFIGDTIGINANNTSIVSSPPRLFNSALVYMFFTDYANTGLSVVGSSSDYDFVVPDSNTYYKLTVLGRRFLNVLESLGYKICLSNKDDGLVYNGLALLAYARVFLDWYANHNYLNTADVLEVQKYLSYNDPTIPLILTHTHIYKILSLCDAVNYDNEDYVTAAWDNPVSPVSGQFTAMSFTDPSSTGGAYVQTSSNGTPEMVTNSLYPSSIGTTYIHEALKKLTDYQKRHALVGALNIDRALSEHGFISPYLRLMRSVYVGSDKTIIDTGSVMATATSTDGVNESSVGDYAGAGFGKSQNSKTFDYQASEDGIFIICASIIPVGSLVQGYDRNNRLLTKEQFFNADFDALGLSAIEKGEVYVSDSCTFVPNNTTEYTGVFGFTGQYGEKKRPKSFLTGDMRYPNFYKGGSSWHLFRLFQDGSFLNSSNTPDVSAVVHSLDFTTGHDAWQYHRIFQQIVSDYDPFFCFFRFNMVSYAPMKPLFDTYEFDSDGKEITFDNSSKVN